MPVILVFFHTPGCKNKPLNHLVAQYDPPYSHCDMQFEDGMMSSVYQHCGACWRKCDFSGRGLCAIRVEVSDAGYQRAYDMCARRAENGCKFDFTRVYCFLLHANSDDSIERSNRTFCSKQCVEVLQMAGAEAVLGMVGSNTTPSALFRALDANVGEV
jgi:hypothetical protein